MTTATDQIAAGEIPRLQWDFRLGGVPRLALATEAELMQIPAEISKCVAFLGCDAPTKGGTTIEPRLLGTAFFVGLQIDLANGKTGEALYAITAAHVLDEIDNLRSSVGELIG